MYDKKLANFSWVLLAYTILVIVFGAFVRATKSGAGCGSHWPLCNGVVVPRAPAIETVIEFSHRITSGFTIILIGILIFWIWRKFPGGSFVRKSAAASVFFIITESLIGAGLVLFELVAHNDSMARAFAMMGHLVNTFLLLASLFITAMWVTVRIPKPHQDDRKAKLFGAVGIVGLMFLGASGAITALGDTLFPANSLVEGFQQEFAATSHVLLRLRVFHPFIAAVVGAYCVWFAFWLASRQQTTIAKKLAYAQASLIVLQMILGAINVVLLAPVWMQLVHLFVTTLIWINFVGVNILAWIAADFVTGICHDQIHDRVDQAAAG